MAVKLNPGIGSIPAGKWVSHGLVAILALAFGFVVVMILVWGMPDRDSLPKRASLNATTDPEGVVGGITETGDQLLAGNEDGTAAASGPTGSSGEDPGAEVEAERRLAEIRRRQDEAQRRLEELEFQAQHAPLGQEPVRADTGRERPITEDDGCSSSGGPGPAGRRSFHAGATGSAGTGSGR